jgi:hypothetical protein
MPESYFLRMSTLDHRTRGDTVSLTAPLLCGRRLLITLGSYHNGWCVRLIARDARFNLGVKLLV